MVVGFSSEATASSRGRFTMCRVNGERERERWREGERDSLERVGEERDGGRRRQKREEGVEGEKGLEGWGRAGEGEEVEGRRRTENVCRGGSSIYGGLTRGENSESTSSRSSVACDTRP